MNLVECCRNFQNYYENWKRDYTLGLMDGIDLQGQILSDWSFANMIVYFLYSI